MFKISEFLKDYSKESNTGKCIVCAKSVQWARKRVASHKRENCSAASVEERRLFSEQPVFSDDNDSSLGSTSEATNNVAIDETNVLTAEKKSEIDSALSQLFFRTGLSFRILDSEAFGKYARLLNPTYAQQLPTSRTLSGVMLDREYKIQLEKVVKVMAESRELSLVTDGWTNVRGDHIVNFLVKAPNRPSMFYKSINTTGVLQNSANTAASIIEIIEELGPEKFTSVVSDNAPVLKSAWRLVEEKFSHISAYGCAAHCLNLLIKDILEPHGNLLSEASKIIKFFNNHHRSRSLFESSQRTEHKGRKLIVAVPTRWYSQYSSLQSILESKYIFMKLVDQNAEDLKQISTTKAPAVIKIIKSATFWNNLASVVKLIEYPVKIIGKSWKQMFHFSSRSFNTSRFPLSVLQNLISSISKILNIFVFTCLFFT